MEEQIAKDLIIPNEDRKFLLLPDMQEKKFLDIGELKDYVQNEIARWTNVDATIENKYKSVLSKIGVVAKDAKEGCIASGALAEVKKLLQEWSANGNGVNSCVNSNSRFGQYLRELKARNLAPQFFRDCSLLAMVVLDYPLPQYNSIRKYSPWRLRLPGSQSILPARKICLKRLLHIKVVWKL
jgi:hypothetical protein